VLRTRRVLSRDEGVARLAAARLMLLFTPDLCRAGCEPLEVLEEVLQLVDVVQVRIKDGPGGRSTARGVHDWAVRVLELVAAVPDPPLVLVNDRVDVAAVLRVRGIAGVHLGSDDAPVEIAREILGPEALVGLSTHAPGEVARAQVLPLDYLGFGPVHPTKTKGYGRGLGAEAAWIASEGSALPLFPIGGIDRDNAVELAPVGRAVVGSAILGAEEPARAARAIRAALVDREG
jgi:thiamine-phosphate pyrophosphorylase